MFEKSDAFDMFLTELFDEKLRVLSKTDGAYGKLKAEIAAESYTMQWDFTRSDLDIIENFNGMLSGLNVIERRHLYFEGFRDCIRLLKRLEVY